MAEEIKELVIISAILYPLTGAAFTLSMAVNIMGKFPEKKYAFFSLFASGAFFLICSAVLGLYIRKYYDSGHSKFLSQFSFYTLAAAFLALLFGIVMVLFDYMGW